MEAQRYWDELGTWSETNPKLAKLVSIVALSWVYAACSQVVINLPFGLVPISLQPLPLFLAASLFGPTSVYAYVLYYVQGLCGAPFFSNAGSGILHAAGPTGGYLIGFFFSMVFLSTFRNMSSTAYGLIFFKFLIAECIFFSFGLFQLSFFVPTESVLMVGLYPFIIGDSLKIIIGAGLVALHGALKKRS